MISAVVGNLPYARIPGEADAKKANWANAYKVSVIADLFLFGLIFGAGFAAKLNYIQLPFSYSLALGAGAVGIAVTLPPTIRLAALKYQGIDLFGNAIPKPVVAGN